jgi:hypothetical protein
MDTAKRRAWAWTCGSLAVLGALVAVMGWGLSPAVFARYLNLLGGVVLVASLVSLIAILAASKPER